jgi:hypothetical protein
MGVVVVLVCGREVKIVNDKREEKNHTNNREDCERRTIKK